MMILTPYVQTSKRSSLTQYRFANEQVHLKERNYPCHQCGNCFARKDTLTRYVYASENEILDWAPVVVGLCPLSSAPESEL